MLWLGDNVYYWGKDFTSSDRMFKRQMYYRKHDRLNELLGNQPNYAIWDDHDYGPNNSACDYPYKDTALYIHQHFWPALSYGNDEASGIFSKFEYEDALFLLMDDRYHQTKAYESGTVYGHEQLAWMKNELLHSEATFKFVCTGFQVLNPITDSETLRHFQSEKRRNRRIY